MHVLILALFYAAILVAGVFGTETRLLFFWPVAALLGLAGVAGSLRRKIRVSFPPSDWCMLTMLAAAGYFAGRAALSPVLELAREDLMIICACLVAYVITVTTASHPRWRSLLLVVLVVLAVGNLGVGLIHFKGDWDFHVLPQFARSFEPGRIGGFYNNPNHLAAFFSVVVFMSLGSLCFGRGGAGWKLILAFMVIACSLGMALTISRGALLACGAGALVFALLGVWIVWHSHRYLLVKLLAGSAVLALIAGTVLWKVNEDYLRRRVSEQENTADVRLGIWGAARVQHAAQPWVGEGARQFYDGCVRYRQPITPIWTGDAQFVHNEYLQALADYGWVGLALMLAAFGTHLAHGLIYVRWFIMERFSRTGMLLSNSLAATVGSLSALVASAVHALVEFHWHVGGIAVLAAVLMGVLANPGFEGVERRPRRLPGVRWSVRLSFAGAAVALLWWSWDCGRADFYAARAETLNRRHDLGAVTEDLDRSVRLDPSAGSKRYKSGLHRLNLMAVAGSDDERLELIEEARTDFEEAARLNPFRFLYATALADVYLALGMKEDALREIHRGLTLAPLHEEARLALAFFYHRQGLFEDAERAYLWASKAPAANQTGSLNWIAGYQQLLQDAQMEVPSGATDE